MKKKNIVIVLWKASPGGLEKVITYYLKYMQKDFNFEIFSLKKPPNINYFESYNVKIYFGGFKKKDIYFRFVNFAFENRDKIFHCFNTGPIILLLLRISACQKVVYHIHGTIYWKKYFKKYILKPIWRLALSREMTILANSNYSSKIFREKVSDSYPIKVIFNPFDVNKFILNKCEGKKLRIFYVGRLVDGKNLFKWLDVAKKIKDNFMHVEFHIYGDGPLKENLIDYSINLGLKNRINFHGFVKDIEKFYSKNSLLLFLSEYESFGNVIVESILSGTPVIASNIPSHREILKNFNEFLVDLDGNYAESIILKIQNFESLKKTALNAQLEFKKRFNLDKHLETIKTIYIEM